MVEIWKARSLASHILGLAASTGTSLKGHQVAIDHLEVAESHVGAKADILGIYEAVRLESGLPYKNGVEK
jgi:hypothetical protein